MMCIHSRFLAGMATGGVLVAAGMLLGGLALPKSQQVLPHDRPVADEAVIRARSLEIVDELGTVVLAIGQNAQGGSISIRNRFGATMTLLASTADAGGMIAINNAQGQPACTAAATPDGGHLTVRTSEGVPAASMRATSDHGGEITCHNSQGDDAAQLTADVSGAGMIETFGRRDGSLGVMVSLGSTIGGHGRLTTYSGPDRPLVALTASAEHDGQVLTYGANGLPLIALATIPQRPVGNAGAGVGGSVGGGASLRVFNERGEAIITLDGNEDGHGEIGVWRADGTGRTIKP